MKSILRVITFFAAFSAISAHAQLCSCQPPSQVVGATCVVPSNTTNACDDGTSSGTPSLVSTSVSGATAALKFDSVVNKKLACCLNAYDPANPAQLKYDCVDNSTTHYASFDQLWAGTDGADSGSQAYGLILSGGGAVSGMPLSGFYTLSGSRCSEFSEFAGPIHSAKVNPMQMSGQQDKIAAIGSPACAIMPGAYSVSASPSPLTTAVVAAGKIVPYDGLSLNDCTEAANMRRCPILVRAAMVATCPRNPVLPGAQPTYQDTLGVNHCLAASSVRVFIHMEQIYEVAGMPTMKTFDTYQQQNSPSLSISGIIQNKSGNACPAGTSYKSGTCMGCTAGCGGISCAACPAGTFSITGDTQCTPCAVGTYSLGSANLCTACTNTPGGYYWVGNGSSPGGCATAKCINTGTGFGGVSPNCPP
jgi:hypothetical protein